MRSTVPHVRRKHAISVLWHGPDFHYLALRAAEGCGDARTAYADINGSDYGLTLSVVRILALLFLALGFIKARRSCLQAVSTHRSTSAHRTLMRRVGRCWRRCAGSAPAAPPGAAAPAALRHPSLSSKVRGTHALPTHPVR